VLLSHDSPVEYEVYPDWRAACTRQFASRTSKFESYFLDCKKPNPIGFCNRYPGSNSCTK